MIEVTNFYGAQILQAIREDRSVAEERTAHQEHEHSFAEANWCTFSRLQEKIESGKRHQCCCDGLQQIKPVQNLGIHAARQSDTGQGTEKSPCHRKAECHHGTDPHPRSDGLKKKKEGVGYTFTHSLWRLAYSIWLAHYVRSNEF